LFKACQQVLSFFLIVFIDSWLLKCIFQVFLDLSFIS
jgi:hypothetical protein